MNNIAELAPCPFCGSTDVGVDRNDENDFDVTCWNCHAGTIGVGPGAEGIESAIEAWSRREHLSTTIAEKDAALIELANEALKKADLKHAGGRVTQSQEWGAFSRKLRALSQPPSGAKS